MKTLVHIKTAVIIVNPGGGVQAQNGIRDSRSMLFLGWGSGA